MSLSLRARTLGYFGIFAIAAGASQPLVACGAEPDAEPPRDARRVTLSTTPDVATVVESNDAFAWSLYSRVRSEPGNLFFSPFSISAALSMTLLGARGQTRDEMRSVLYVDDESAHHPTFGALLQDIGGTHLGRGYRLHVANALFGQSDYQFSSDFIATADQVYAAPLTLVDFGATDLARATINGWVSEQTEGALPELLQAGSIDGLTRLVLANAIYFDAEWATAFDPNKTVPADFTLTSGEVRSVPMMSTTGQFRYLESVGMTLVELPYQDDEVEMLAILPVNRTLAELEATLPAALDAEPEPVAGALDVRFPKFAMTHRIPLKQALIDLGMPSAFDGSLADLSGLVPADAGRPDLYIQDTVHQAHVSVDERGTEAAAATAVVVGTRSARPQITFDRPFLFLIRDRLTGSILFMGRVEDP